MKWIKAIDQLPGLAKPVKWKSDLVDIEPEPQWVEVILELYAHVKNSLEWCDENPPPPDSAEDEAARMYPEPTGKTKEMPYKDYEIVDKLREAHITCAGMYTDMIDKLKAEVEHWKDEFESAVLELREFKNKHNL